MQMVHFDPLQPDELWKALPNEEDNNLLGNESCLSDLDSSSGDEVEDEPVPQQGPAYQGRPQQKVAARASARLHRNDVVYDAVRALERCGFRLVSVLNLYHTEFCTGYRLEVTSDMVFLHSTHVCILQETHDSTILTIDQ